MREFIRKLRGGLLVSLIAGLGINLAGAQNYPSRPVQFHVGGAGSSSDIVARIMGPDLGVALGQPAIMVNRPPGFGLVDGVVKSAPDGYTLLANGSPIWIAPLFAKAPYDTIRDLAPISMMTQAAILLVVHPSLPVKSVAELIALAKSKPGQINFSTGGNGGASHIANELFKYAAKIDTVRIPYKGGAEESRDLISGVVQMTISASVRNLVDAGKMRALATVGAKRSVFFPDLPTVAETLPGFESGQANALMAPAKTPDAIIRRLNQDMQKVLDKPEMRKRLLEAGVEPVGGPPEQLDNYVKADIAKVSRLIKEGIIKTE